MSTTTPLHPSQQGDGGHSAAPSLLRRVLTSRGTRNGLILMLVVLAVALLGPFFAPHTPSEIVARPFAGRGDGLPLGADYLGHDVLSRFLWGGRSLILMTVAAAVLGTAAGTALGLVAAYSGGIVDAVLMRCVDVLLAFPTVVLALLVVAMLGPTPTLLVVVVAVSHVASVSRVMRGASLRVVGTDYVLWARAIGLPHLRIVRQLVLPNVTSPLMVEFGLRLMWSVGALAAMSFLGQGIQPPAADWGLMINENRNGLSVQPLTVVVPILAIAVFTVGGNLFAEGLARLVARTQSEASA